MDVASGQAAPVAALDPMLRTARWLDLGAGDPRLPPVCLVGVAAGTPASAYERFGIVLPATLRHAVPKRQSGFLAGRLAARMAIERLGVVASMPGIGPSREPLWQAGVMGSISHTDALAGAIAVPSAQVNGVGIDIENAIEGESRQAIEALAFSPGELDLLEARRSRLSAGLILAIGFSAKESFFKGAFPSVGRFFDFSAVRISDLDAEAGRLTLTLQETLCHALPARQSFDLVFRRLDAGTVVTGFAW